ncbi:MAG: hypothetical protein KatS3mg068_2571 [Candidatus Sericytochromatia bacterium]|nr:MAG: hypothetical protein KatS3mg068_1893 [Candidatus Sericytochromatia bacterium]GIW23502.1 MAG: hypothetical protein KatS3mg068_2509 [Candidatus Sericytochromatia bacterium]GIW23564.1 MAG: hypothetical protein KatS3mg068_2571 [Candidatus Sericytochromatia bacterium]
MANLTETTTWENGIYQIETTDPVLGGPTGIANIQAKQLANRTKWLKQIADEVVNARGTYNNLDERLDQYDAYTPENQNNIISFSMYALEILNTLAAEIDNIEKRLIIQGATFIKNKYVVSGFTLTKADIRALHLSRTGTITSGNFSTARINGEIISLDDDDYHVSVPTNETSSDKIYYAYLKKQNDNSYRVDLAQSVPNDALLLYTLNIPANDTASNLNSVTLTDNRIIQADNSWITNFTPSSYVALPFTLLNNNYTVLLEIENATNISAISRLAVKNKATNGFNVEMLGSADNVQIKWTVINNS